MVFALYLLPLVVGLALLIGGGELLVRGASALARQLGISPLIIGLTVVAFGTSAPELAVNTIAAVQGKSDLSFGNIIGSNIANIGLIVGITALIKPLDIHRSIVTREIPMMLLASAVALVNALDVALDGAPFAFYSRTDAFLLLMLFGVFMYYTASDVLSQRAGDPVITVVETGGGKPPKQSLPVSLVLVALGLVGLIGGGQVTVWAAVEIATLLGVPDVIVGLTIIAVGTSLPELAAGIVATYRGHTDLAVGNVVGSNIFNLLLVQGVTAAIGPVVLPEGGMIDLMVMVGFSIVLLPFSISHQQRVVRAEGAFLLVTFLAYHVWRFQMSANSQAVTAILP